MSLAKAWKEMGHRYLAAMLGLVIVLLAAWSWVLRQAALGLAALAVQIALGGWVSANYAALACPGRLDHDPDFCGLAPLSAAIGALLVIQFSLGIANVAFGLPLALAAAHNAGAALLVAALVVLSFSVFRGLRPIWLIPTFSPPVLLPAGLSAIRSSTWPCSLPRFSPIITFSLALSLLAGCDSGPKFKSTDISGVDYGRWLELTDHTGRIRRLEDFRGKAVVVFFGFTQCPDVCPTTLAEVSTALKKLGPDANRVQVLFVTVDPERDTQELLAKYVTAFDPRFLGLYGDAAATQRTAKEFKVYYEKRKQGDSYTVDHSAQTYVIDPQGRLRLFVRHDRIASDLPEDLRTLLKEKA